MRKKHRGGIYYLTAWVLLVALFWSGLVSGSDALGYGLLSQYIVLPIGAFAAALFYGKKHRPIYLLFIPLAGLSEVLLQSLTFDLANTLSVGHINMPSWDFAILTILPAAVGMGLGYIISRRKT